MTVGTRNFFKNRIPLARRSFARLSRSLPALLALLGLTRSYESSANAQVFVENWSYRTIGEYTTTGSAINRNLITLPSGATGPVGMALDGAGNLFIGDGNQGTVREYNSTSGAVVNSSFISGLGRPYGIALDGQGHIYVADAGNLNIGVYDATTGAPVNTSLISFSSSPLSIAFDGQGDMFVGYGSVVGEFNAMTGAAINPTLITGLSQPSAMVYNGQGDLFVADANLGTIGEYTTGGVTVNASLVSRLNDPDGLAIGADGNLYVSVWGEDLVGEYTQSGTPVRPALINLNGYAGGVTVVVPEPSSVALCGVAAALCLLCYHRKPISVR